MDTLHIHDQKTETPCCLAIATVPCQPWCETYDQEKALSVGTIFPNLHMPFFKGGDANER